jgi:Xaa-Pro dipeptidase
VTVDVLGNRRAAVQSVMADRDVQLLVVGPSTNHEYLTGEPRLRSMATNLEWPSWWTNSLWMTQRSRPILLVPRMALEYQVNNPHGIDVCVVPDAADPVDTEKKLLGELGVDGGTVAIDDRVPARMAMDLMAAAPSARLVSATPLMQRVRRNKTKAEIEVMREACQVTDRCFTAVVEKITRGMTERDLTDEIEFQMRSLGTEPAYPIGAWGWGPDYPRQRLNREHPLDVPLLPGTILGFDFGIAWNGYCTDFSRSVHLKDPTPEIARAHQALVRSQRAVIRALRPGRTTAEDVYEIGMSVLGEAHLGEYFSDRIGHGIGLDIHESPSLYAGDTTPIEIGMVLAVEPQVTTSDMHLRLEDLVVVGDDRTERLNEYPQDLIVV